MSRIQNVSRKDGTYYFRRMIRLGDDKPFRIRMSLRTMSHARARIMAPALTVASEALRMNMMQNIGRDGLSAEERAEIYRRQMLHERDRLEAGHAALQLVDLNGELPEAVLHIRLDASEAASLDRTKNGETGTLLVIRTPPEAAPEDEPIEILSWEDFIGGLGSDDAAEMAELHLASLGGEATPLRRQMAKRVIHQAKVEAVREYRQRIEQPGMAYPAVPVAPFNNQYGASLVNSSADKMAPVAPTLSGHSPYSAMPPSQAASAFIDKNPRTGGHDGASRKKGTSWTAKTREQFKLPALLLEQVMGGRPLVSITDEDLVELDRCFNNLHGPSFRKSPKHRSMTILEIVEETKERIAKKELSEDDIGLGIGTTNRHWGFLRQLTTWISRHHPIADLDYSAFIIDDDRDPRELRDTYTIEEGRELFTLPPWTGCASINRRLEPGKIIIHDAFYFVPLIAWYSGLRRGEICGLTLADIEEKDGHWHFNIQANEVRDLKTSTSKRLVPFAGELHRLRFPEYVVALRDAGETLLFPELASESGKGTMGDTYYKNAWTKIAPKLSFIERGQAVHSFRHTVTDELKKMSVFEEVRADLVGHKIQSETGGRYSKASPLAILRKAIAKIPNVTRHLTPAPLSILPAKARGARSARKQPNAHTIR